MIVICKSCGVEFDKCAWQAKKHKNHFCTHSCAAKYSNTRRASRLKKECKSCGEKIRSQWTYCGDCKENRKRQIDILDESRPISYYASKTDGSNRYRGIRLLARKKTKLWPQVCQHCPYELHVETCHVKGISSFSFDTLISVVNADDNLLLLCRNCHWEFDRGLIRLGLMGAAPITYPL